MRGEYLIMGEYWKRWDKYRCLPCFAPIITMHPSQVTVKQKFKQKKIRTFLRRHGEISWMLPLGHGFDCTMHVTSKKRIGNRATSRMLPLLPYNGPCYHLIVFTGTIAAGSSEAIIYVEVLTQMASVFSSGKFYIFCVLESFFHSMTYVFCI